MKSKILLNGKYIFVLIISIVMENLLPFFDCHKMNICR